MHILNTSNPTIIFNNTTSEYQINYEGKVLTTTVTNNSATITEWVQKITSKYGGEPTIVGFDIKWQRPHKFRWATEKIPATLQLCIGAKCLILQLRHMRVIPETLKRFLVDPNFTFAGVKAVENSAKLRKEYGLQCTKIAVVVLGKSKNPLRCFPRSGFDEIVGMKIKKPKHVRESNWEVKDLSEDQILYASLDAYASCLNSNPLVLFFSGIL